MKPETS